MKKILTIACILIFAIPIWGYAEPTETVIIDDQTGPKEVVITEDQTEPKEVIITQDYTQQITTNMPPMPPLNVRYNNVTPNTISLVWDDNPGFDQVDSYNIYVNGIKAGATDVSAYVVENLDPGRTYEITVSAINFYGESFESDPVTITTPKLQGIAPTNIKILNITENSIFLTWEGEGLYNIYLNGEFLETVSKTHYQIDNLEGSTDYEIMIESFENSFLSSIGVKTGEAIQQETIQMVITTGSEYISSIWPYIAVIAGMVITFAIADMILGVFENFRLG